MDRSTRNLSIITLLVLVIFLALNNIARRSDLAAWGVVALFLLVAVFIWYYDRLRRRGIDDSEAPEKDYIEPLIFDNASLPDTIELVAPNPGTVIDLPTSRAPVAEAAPPAPAPAKPAKEPRELEPDVSPKPTADVPEAPPAHSEFPDAPLHDEDARAPMPSDVVNAAPPPVKEVKPPSAPAAPTTTVEEKTAAPPPSASAPATPAPKVQEKAAPPLPKAEPKPASSKKAAPAQADDLKIVEGIGPKMEKALNAAGISTFAQLAAASEDQINAAIVAAGMRFAPSVPTWAEQANYAAKGDKVGLEAFQKTLKGGRKGKK